MTERRKYGITEGQGESSIAPLFQSGAIITELSKMVHVVGMRTEITART